MPHSGFDICGPVADCLLPRYKGQTSAHVCNRYLSEGRAPSFSWKMENYGKKANYGEGICFTTIFTVVSEYLESEQIFLR